MNNEAENMIQENVLKGLKSSDSQKVIETIGELRESGNVAYIPLLLDLLSSTPEIEIKKKIRELFSNLKDSDAISIIISAILDPKFDTELKGLVSSCWENGLDYTGYLSLFVDLLIEKDLEVAFEAYTVIMNTENKIDQSIIDIQIGRLEKALISVPELKRQLLLDVIDFLPSIGF
jgi:hypothetical protein